MVEIAKWRDGAEMEDLGHGEKVLGVASGDEEGVELLEMVHGPAFLQNWDAGVVYVGELVDS